MAHGAGAELKRWGRQIDRNYTRGVLRGDLARTEVKKGWNKFRNRTGIFPQAPEPPAPPPPPSPAQIAAPGSRGAYGTEQTNEYRGKRGRRSTRRVARTPLGGGAMLT